MLHATWQFLTRNGIGQNLTAALIWGAAVFVYDRVALKPQRRMVAEVHKILRHAHPDVAAHLDKQGKP